MFSMKSLSSSLRSMIHLLSIILSTQIMSMPSVALHSFRNESENRAEMNQLKHQLWLIMMLSLPAYLFNQVWTALSNTQTHKRHRKCAEMRRTMGLHHHTDHYKITGHKLLERINTLQPIGGMHISE